MDWNCSPSERICICFYQLVGFIHTRSSLCYIFCLRFFRLLRVQVEWSHSINSCKAWFVGTDFQGEILFLFPRPVSRLAKQICLVPLLCHGFISHSSLHRGYNSLWALGKALLVFLPCVGLSFIFCPTHSLYSLKWKLQSTECWQISSV